MLYKAVTSIFLLAFCVNKSAAQTRNDFFNPDKIYNHLRFLASDSLKGRANFSKEILIAGEYISNEFRKNNLQPFPGFFDFYQPFNGGINKKIQRDKLSWNGKSLSQEQFYYFTDERFPETRTLADFKIIEVEKKLYDSVFFDCWNDTFPTLIWFKENQSKNQKININDLHIPGIAPFTSVLVVSSDERPVSLEMKTDRTYKENILFNIIGLLPGKSKPAEVILFSAHYDHVGIDNRLRNDSIFNGANDNASGTGALLSLAEYYTARNDNERTILFCAFAGEELGLLGSKDFAEVIKSSSVKAVVNLEMLGKTISEKKGSFFITGENLSNLKKILQGGLRKHNVEIMNEPNDFTLFKRSDNYPFALKGIPAHTIMSSYDNDPCYHRPCDELKNMDIINMQLVISNIAAACESLISGKDTPKRIKKEVISKNIY
jgi:hypothetical protein